MQTANSQIVAFLFITTFLIVLLLASIVTILFLYQKKRIIFHDQIAQAQLEIQEETFQNISREIHDNIGLSLTVAKLHLNTINLQSLQSAHFLIESSIELIGQAINDLSDISKSLNSDTICNHGLLNAIDIKLDKIKKAGKFKVVFRIKGDPVFMHSQKEVILYRIFQESLNNIIKHSKADKISVLLIYDGSLQLIVKDNGIGISKDEIENATPCKIMTGLNNIKKRTKMLNGIFNLDSNNLGTTIHITVPLEKDEK